MMEIEKKKILLIDDEEAILDVAGRALKKYFRVCTARDGREALEVLSGLVVDCIVLDIEMPSMDGIEFLKRLRGSGTYTPVIVVTGKSCQKYAEEAADMNIQGYVIKPYTTNALAERISSVIASPRMSLRQTKPSAKKLHPGLKYAVDFLNNNYNKSVNVYELAKGAGMAYSHFAELFKKEFGMTLTSYLNRFRVEKAKQLIKETDLPLSEIMTKVGFNTEQHFFSQFKRFTGVTPKSLRG